MMSWHRPHLDRLIFLDFKFIHGMEHVFEVVVDLNTKASSMWCAVDNGDHSRSWVAKDSRVLVVMKKQRDPEKFINTIEFHEECVRRNCKVYIAGTERNIHFFNNVNWMIDEIKERRYTNLTFAHYSEIPRFSEKRNIIEDQIPVIEEWRYLASESLLKRHSNKGAKNETYRFGKGKPGPSSKPGNLS